MNQIQSIDCAEHFSDLNSTEWLIVARRSFVTGDWIYTWPDSDCGQWNAGKADGSVLCTQRKDRREWVTLAKVAR